MTLLAQIQAIFLAIQAAWPVILVVIGLLLSILSTIATATTNHPNISNWLHKAMSLLSWAQHQNVGGWKWPFTLPTAPVVGQPVAPVVAK
jgi:sulfite exporter TauE/SafE